MDTFSKDERSRIMARVRSKGNKSTEEKFIGIMKKRGITGWRRNYPAEGNPDFVFPAAKLAVFIDGCFWHKCPKHCRIPKTNSAYWIRKIDRNSVRGREVNRALIAKGWKVIRFWEHDLSGGGGFRSKLSRLKKRLAVIP